MDGAVYTNESLRHWHHNVTKSRQAPLHEAKNESTASRAASERMGLEIVGSFLQQNASVNARKKQSQASTTHKHSPKSVGVLRRNSGHKSAPLPPLRTPPAPSIQFPFHMKEDLVEHIPSAAHNRTTGTVVYNLFWHKMPTKQKYGKSLSLDPPEETVPCPTPSIEAR